MIPMRSRVAKRPSKRGSFSPAPWPFSAYENAWKSWQPAATGAAPAKYDEAFPHSLRDASSPFDNGKYPMEALRPGTLFGIKGLTTDCMICHGGSIFGKSYVGLGQLRTRHPGVFRRPQSSRRHRPQTPPYILQRARHLWKPVPWPSISTPSAIPI